MPTNPQSGRRLANRTALITGASRGIGRAIATEFAVEGADLFLCATGSEKLRKTRTIVSEFGGRTELAAADVSEPDEMERLFDAAVSAFGRIDIVVNNAGVYKPAKFLDYTPEVFDRIMRVNTYGVFHVMQRAVRHMLDNGVGMIVNITSTAGKWESPNQSAYNASKHAVVGLIRASLSRRRRTASTSTLSAPSSSRPTRWRRCKPTPTFSAYRSTR